jgi:archaellum component FlaC
LDTERKFVRWSDDEESILFEVQNFKKLILPHYFHHASITSFVRQLNAHGFKKKSKIKVDVKKPVSSRSKYHNKYIHFRPEVFVKTKNSSKSSLKEDAEDKTFQPETMVYHHPHFIKSLPQNFGKIQRENSTNQFKLLMNSYPVDTKTIPTTVSKSMNSNIKSNIESNATSNRTKYRNKYIHVRITDELNKLKIGNSNLKTNLSTKTSEQHRLNSEQTLLHSTLETTNNYMNQFYSLFSKLMLDTSDTPALNSVLDNVVNLKTLLEWELDDGKWLEDFEKNQKDAQLKNVVQK